MEIEGKLENLEKRLENSTKSLKNFLIFFLVYATYILITAFAVKDVQLLFPFLGVHLPLLNIDINLEFFILVAPLFLLIFYINLLLNLHEHMKIIREIEREIENEGILIKPLIPFIVDYAFLNKEKTAKIFEIIVFNLIFIYPIIVAGLLSWRFLDFQSVFLSIVTTVVFFLVAGISLYSYIYIYSTYLFRDKTILRVSISIFFLFILLVFSSASLFFLLKKLPSFLNNLHTYLNYLLYIYSSYKTEKDLYFYKSKILEIEIIFVLFEYHLIFSLVLVFCFLFFPLFVELIGALFIRSNLPTGRFFIKNILCFLLNTIIIFIISYIFMKIELFTNYKPHIAVKSTEEIYFPDISKYEKYVKFINEVGKTNNNKTLPLTLSLENLPRIDLSERNLNYAKLRNLFMPLADMERVNFYGADLMGINLYKANLELSNLTGTNLELANLSGAVLSKAYLYKAKLKSTNLMSAVLSKANLEAADLSEAILFKANLESANLSEANLESVNLSGAILNSTNLSRANLRKTYLEEAILKETKLKKTVLLEVLFNGADIEQSNFACSISFKSKYSNVENFKKAIWNDALIILPIIDRNNIEIKSFLSEPKFIDFENWYEKCAKDEDYKLILNYLYIFKEIIIDDETNDYIKKEAWLTVVKIIKNSLYFSLSELPFSEKELRELNKKYSTGNLRLTEEEIKKLRENEEIEEIQKLLENLL
ncbi:pentapeptide repeat-containing protein [Persephonella sp.]